MSTPDSTQPNPNTPATSPHPSKTVVLRNSRLICWFTFVVAIASAFLGVCMMLMVISVLTPLSAISFMRVLAAAEWGLGGVMFCLMCPALCKWSLRMLHVQFKLNEGGARFLLGTREKPVDLFMPWDQIVRVEQKRVSNAHQFTITAREGSFVQFNSYTFFRPGRAARMVAERAGLTVQKV